MNDQHFEILDTTSTSDDILAKYRTKQPNGPSTSVTAELPENRSSENEPNGDSSTVEQTEEVCEPELNIHCETFMFENAKKKLRFVLSNAEIQQIPCTSNDLRSLVSVYIFE